MNARDEWMNEHRIDIFMYIGTRREFSIQKPECLSGAV